MHCLRCRYNLEGVDGECPECGRVFVASDPRTFASPGRGVPIRSRCAVFLAAMAILPIPMTIAEFALGKWWLARVQRDLRGGGHAWGRAIDALETRDNVLLILHLGALPALGVALVLLGIVARRPQAPSRRDPRRLVDFTFLALSAVFVFVVLWIVGFGLIAHRFLV
jgi:hypothetical protein